MSSDRRVTPYEWKHVVYTLVPTGFTQPTQAPFIHVDMHPSSSFFIAR